MIAEIEQVPASRSVDELLETTSATRLQTFHQCRLKFYFRYVLGIKKARTSALFVGSMVHSVLQQWNLARWREGKVEPEKLKLQLDEEWTTELEQEPVRWDQGEEPVSKKETWSLFEIYLKQTPITTDERPEAVEVSVEADLARHGLPLVVTAFGPMTEQQKTRLFRTIESYVNGIQNEDWVPSPSPMSCACCEFFNECRAWH